MCGTDQTKPAPKFAMLHQRAGGALPAAVADHHLHIQSDNASTLLKGKASRSPEQFTGISSALLETRTGADAIAALDDAGIEKGVLLSEAYMFASPFALKENLDVSKLTRLENGYNVDAALRSNGRLKAFIGVNPLFEGAPDEVDYWKSRYGVTGIKLHLGNSGFKPRLARHVSKLSHFLDVARSAALPVIIHVRNDNDYTKADVETFIDKVLPHAGTLPVQIAHAGGHGGLDEITLTALSCYADAIGRGAPGTDGLFFDIAAVGVTRAISEETAHRLLQSLAQLMRTIGLSRFVMGSDWPSVCLPREHNLLQQSQFPLSADEWLIILQNRAPYLK